MNYPQVSIEKAGAELNRLHREIEDKLRSTVQDALRAGEILTQLKDRVGHGNFLPWIKGNCNFSERTARNYMGLFEYRDKTATVADLQEAYTLIDDLEAQSRKTEEQRSQERVSVYLKTGQKPEGWRRGTDDKVASEAQSRKARIEKAQEELLREHEERTANGKETRKHDSAEWLQSQIDEAVKSVSAGAAKTLARQSWKEKIRLSHDGMSDPFSDALIDYLESLESDSRKIEACHNLIKICKRIASDLQAVHV